MSARRIVLASRSPRRRQLLEAAGWIVDCRPAPIDDGTLDPGLSGPAQWTEALAWLKAKAVAELPETTIDDLLLAADTVCAVENVMLGQPEDRNHARGMLQSMRGRSHTVWTGMCVLPPGGERRIDSAMATVHLGDLSDADIEAYLDTDGWRGKAGAYNLSDRIDAGWPVTCDGDHDTVMGLSLALLEQLLQAPAA